MCGEEGLLTNFPKFHEDHATSTMFSQCCRKTYQADRVINVLAALASVAYFNDRYPGLFSSSIIF